MNIQVVNYCSFAQYLETSGVPSQLIRKCSCLGVETSSIMNVNSGGGESRTDI